MAKLLQGEELEKRTVELGIDIGEPPRTQSASGRSLRADDHELQKRVLEAERGIREQKLWLIAVISAIASVLSALAALVAVLSK